MSMEIHIFMRNSQVPSRDAWQQAIERLGFPLIIEPSLDLRKDSAYWPMDYKDEPTGVEVYLDDAADILSNCPPHVVSKVDDRDKCVSFRFGSDMTEGTVAMLAAAALAKLTDGVYLDEDYTLYNAEEVVEVARKDLEEGSR